MPPRLDDDAPLAGQRIAVVHEWVAARAGSEQVFEALAQMFPTADLFALSVEADVHLDVGDRLIQTTFLDAPWWRAHRSVALPVMPLAWWRLGRRDYDVVITSHHAFAHSNRLVRRGGVHLVYVHTPARYVWSPEIDERGARWWMSPFRFVLKLLDRRATRRVTAYAVNSTAVKNRVAEYWGHEATVIHPPVRVEFFAEQSGSPPPTRDYVLGVGRFIPYKNLHLAVEAGDLAGMQVKIAGRGPDKSRIVDAISRARVHAELIDSPDDAALRELYRNAACLVFPTHEDFGIIPVEAQAAGTPIVAVASGGALETVAEGVSGTLLASFDVPEIVNGIHRAAALSGDGPMRQSRRFSRSAFEDGVRGWVGSHV